jgi:hypothetical protein
MKKTTVSQTIVITLACLLGATSSVNAAIMKGPGAPTDSSVAGISDDYVFAELAIATTAIALSAGQNLLKLTFWGTYDEDDTPPTDDFSFWLWGGATATKPAEGTTISDALDIDAFTSRSALAGVSGVYEYVVSFPAPIAITEAGSYFMSVRNATNATLDEAWNWSTTSPAGSRFTRANGDPNDPDDWTAASGADVAFLSIMVWKNWARQ